MRKRIIAKGNVRRGDYMRAVVTDTLPEEVPIIFSNDGFYANLTTNAYNDAGALSFIDTVLDPDRTYTKPYRYSVLKDARSARGLSLIHPSAQIGVARFYAKFDSLICYYAERSVASLRSPSKVGSTFFVKGSLSERNQFRGSSIDTVSLETTVSNPASYFSYNRISRAHEFFDSNEYLHLEKKFGIFRTLDVSKCFGSIYTHTLFWAVADIQTAKDNTSATGFANEFDRLMQSMNYNETNGICVGPEVSRVFAELILSKIDHDIVEQLGSRKLNIRVDYDFRRYVDDYYVFTQDEETADRVTAVIGTCLAKFNLHLNEEKAKTIARPFATDKSRVIAETNAALARFFDQFLSSVAQENQPVLRPKRIWRPDALIRSLVSTVKSTCALHKTGYETVSDYIVSAATKRIVELCNGLDSTQQIEQSLAENYIAAIQLLNETVFFFYTVNPTVRASLNVARTTIISTRLYRAHFPTRLAFLSESIVRWTLDLIKSIARGSLHKDLTAVPVEILNVLIPMREVADAEPLIDEVIAALCESVKDFEYFEIVSFLFLIRDRPAHRTLKASLFARAKEIVRDGLGPRTESQSAHLALDLLACPYLPLDKRASWLNTLRKASGLPNVLRVDAMATVSALEGNPWFVQWDRIDLLSALRKKELSAVY